jgi:transposase
MARRKLTIAERWQAIGMSNTGMSSRNIAVQFNVNHTVIGRLIQCYHQTGTVNDRPRSGRPARTECTCWEDVVFVVSSVYLSPNADASIYWQ